MNISGYGIASNYSGYGVLSNKSKTPSSAFKATLAEKPKTESKNSNAIIKGIFVFCRYIL
jgi:UTP-glucose-1-phosphate uridylyltransferase